MPLSVRFVVMLVTSLVVTMARVVLMQIILVGSSNHRGYLFGVDFHLSVFFWGSPNTAKYDLMKSLASLAYS